MTDVSLRLYCQGLGDCTLISVPREGADPFWMLIDCGIHTSAAGGSEKIARVVADIKETTGGHIDLIVGTHEHWDHLSGFLTAADLFAQCSVGEVWLAWTEDPANPLARKLDKYKVQALDTLAQASVRANGAAGQKALAQGLDSLLGFNFGLQGERVRDARDKLVALGKGNVRYLAPGTVAPLAGGAVNAYVLGPPTDPDLLGLTDSASDTYGFAMDAGWAAAGALGNAFRLGAGDMGPQDDPNAPFDETEGARLSTLGASGGALAEFVSDHYRGLVPDGGSSKGVGSDQAWRRIDDDWLGASAQLALQLDDRTNNTSLVLALEIAATGHVLLFAADAQIGNWKSWPAVSFKLADKTVPALELLARTVFYKVGHHGSANATRSTDGLEAMTSPDLLAFIPTDEAMATKVGWGAIPADGVMKRLQQKTGGRVIRSDRLADVAVGKPAGVVKVDPLYIDVAVS